MLYKTERESDVRGNRTCREAVRCCIWKEGKLAGFNPPTGGLIQPARRHQLKRLLRQHPCEDVALATNNSTNSVAYEPFAHTGFLPLGVSGWIAPKLPPRV